MDSQLNAFEVSGSSPPKRQRRAGANPRAYVLVERPRLSPPTPDQRALLVELLADLLIVSLAHRKAA